MTSTIASSAERIVYRIAGLPVALGALFHSRRGGTGNPLKAAFAWRYWHPDSPAEWSELVGGLVAWPIALVVGALWFTWRNGTAIRRRNGKRVSTQFAEQLKLYFSAGVLPPWYYTFSLDEDASSRRARSFIERFETKPILFPLLKVRKGSPLNDKARFEDHCRAHGIRCVETIMLLDDGVPDCSLPDCDLFVKPLKGRGGKGAERWDLVSPATFASPDGEQLSATELLDRLVERSRHDALIVQPRLKVHPELVKVTAGALPTVRIVTCLDELNQPEVIGGVLRMSIGRNRTVDNFHAGGIAAAVDLDSARLSRATNLGTDARLGWVDAHPDTGAQIEGRRVPLWAESKRLVLDAHRAFTDRVVIGWDVAILEDGPILIEGNGNTDMDILQRFMRVGLREHRFAELLGHHLIERVPGLSERLCVNGDAALDQAHEAGRVHPHQRQADARRARRGAQLPTE